MIATVQWENLYASRGVDGVMRHRDSLLTRRKYSELAEGHERDLVHELRDYEASGGDLDAIRQHIDDAASARVWGMFLTNYKLFLRTGDDEAADAAANAEVAYAAAAIESDSQMECHFSIASVAALSLSEPDAASAAETASGVRFPPRSSNESDFTRTRTDRSSVPPESLETDPDLSFFDKRGKDSDPKEELLEARKQRVVTKYGEIMSKVTDMEIMFAVEKVRIGMTASTFFYLRALAPCA